MCGVTGFLNLGRRSGPDRLRELAGGMADLLRHRGPDDHGVWVDAERGAALGHTRLSIVDLSAAGAQPMLSSCKRYVLSYNGEIYNAAELRDELMAAGRRFRGHSDTEAIVEGFAAWGVRPTLTRLIGMFALAAWDRSDRTMTLVRDRLGIKPVYWGRHNGGIYFASELKALRALPGWRAELDPNALAMLLRTGVVPAPLSIYKGVEKLEPGTLIEFTEHGEGRKHRYWSLADAAHRGQHNLLDIGDAEALEQVERLMADAVARRMVADVPLGAFLSGGVDSSVVTALMQKASARPVRTFSIGYEEGAYDEARHAKQVAAHLGTEHQELVVTAAEAQAVIPKLPEIYDEPFADSSQIPTLLLSQMTRRHVTVALSGDGGDEVFAGYNRYGAGLRLTKLIRRLPLAMRGALIGAISARSPQSWDRIFAALPRTLRPRQAGEKLHKLASVIPEDDIGFYRRLVSQWDDAWTVVNGASAPADALLSADMRGGFADTLSWMQYMDMASYLPDDILTKVDRASMAVSLEVRVPLLDHRLVELSWRLPARFKIRGGQGKWLLRRILYKYVPRQLIERPKTGFAVPIDRWLRGPLRDWATDLLDPKTLREAGLLDPDPIQLKLREHMSGARNWQHALWNVLMFEAWRRHNA